MQTIFVNMEHLLNEYRPHQARETLILMMEEQLERSRAETKATKDTIAKVQGILSDLGTGVEGIPVAENDAHDVQEDEKEKQQRRDEQKQKDIWEAMLNGS
jgi:mediator of RNA polymerase II transcription subunit 7